MNIIDPGKTMMQSLEEACAFHAYRKTRALDTNIALDADYQKNFNNYYRIRRDEQWRQAYYRYLEDNKHHKDITFKQILRYLSEVPHIVRICGKNPDGIARTVEPSFASKMLATINPDHPVWDSQVLRFLGRKVPEGLGRCEKIETCVRIYGEVEQEIGEFIGSAQGKACIELFDKTFPGCRDFSDFKKMDYYMWNLGK